MPVVTRSNGFKLKKGRFWLGIRKKYFTMSVVRHWNRFPGGVTDVSPLEVSRLSRMGLSAF